MYRCSDLHGNGSCRTAIASQTLDSAVPAAQCSDKESLILRLPTNQDNSRGTTVDGDHEDGNGGVGDVSSEEQPQERMVIRWDILLCCD